MSDAAVRIGRVKPAYICSTPGRSCGGRQTKYSSGIKSETKTHSTPQECNKCYIRYLLSIGYKQLGGRELQLGDGPILVLNKASRGYRLRGGKGDRMMSRGNTGGFIYSS